MFTVAEIAAATGGRVAGSREGSVTAVSTDSRSVAPGELFVPLRGDRFDGHDFIVEVTAKGITTVLAEEKWFAHHALPAGCTGVVVKETLRALGDLAAAYRQRFDIPVIAVTGSNGKTTTKEMLATILEKTGPGLKTEGNLNNLIGVPQMLFRLRPEHQWAVLEMGMSEPGEIDRLAEIARPRTGIVLNALPAHLQSMGTVEAVASAKGELLHRVSDGGLAVVNGDDSRVSSLGQNASARRISFGISRGEVRAKEIEHLGLEGESFQIVTPKGEIQVHLRAFGLHNVSNALAATAALLDSVPLAIIKEGLAAFRPYRGRFQLEQVGEVTLVDDSYNANPASMKAALETLVQIAPAGHRVAILGDMLELGEHEAEAHEGVGAVAGRNVDRLFLLGSLMSRHAAQAAIQAGLAPDSVRCGQGHDELGALVIQSLLPGDVVVLKGSRGMAMERTATILRQYLSQKEKG
ncbi:UDP-N-acetylmuramoyl-tripeptide--D-alanyl-D-alanine ligase [Geobacter sp. AOG2]|uniref:UDP-N-acetylmuramoyl-tripeptide--D-alanyl-D- alanine ligase n=1 Tax=Geobacter sp. AOG2 TaxID=1566347 RepID=UPI001CC77948|nr:UDP-N-acetylmuramoyl-tripeptide--D-alanyl-D-alanine ligase [Geobacter sp. AOG2]GFE62367.1 UDP-N-acetylmuramoyl-tripeptide-D-alanyl-D-alanine ligase [Geobacter sp. AOG2]